MTWIIYVLCHVCHGVFGGRLRYSRYAVRPYIGGMYHRGDGMLDVCFSDVYGPTQTLSYDVVIG